MTYNLLIHTLFSQFALKQNRISSVFINNHCFFLISKGSKIENSTAKQTTAIDTKVYQVDVNSKKKTTKIK